MCLTAVTMTRSYFFSKMFVESLGGSKAGSFTLSQKALKDWNSSLWTLIFQTLLYS